MAQSGGGSRYVYGKNSVKALLELHPDRVFKVFLAENLKPDKRVQAIQERVRDLRIPLQVVPRPKLDQMLRAQEEQNASCAPGPGPAAERQQPEKRPEKRFEKSLAPGAEEHTPHQGVIASVAPKALLDLRGLLAICAEKTAQGGFPRVLLLDGVSDPRNFGAILRVADAAGIQGVVVPKHHSAGFGPAVSKAASGAEEAVPVAVVSNLNQAIQQLKENGFWVAGAANDEQAVPYYQQDYQMPVALVLGSEGEGLASLVRKNCDFLVKIPMHGTVDSMNVSTAAAVLLFEMARRRS